MKLFLHIDPKTILESHTAQSPIVQLDEIDALADTIEANMGKEVRVPKEVLDSFMLKDSLNQDIWINGELNPKVRAKLLLVAKDFFKDLEIPSEVKIRDIIFTGSLANFNWSKYSDIDLHIVLDFNDFEADAAFVEDYFYAQKSIWNQEHDITVFGYPVELYVQDINADLAATAIYSVLNNKWIKKPKREEFELDKKAIKDKADKIIYQLRDIRQDYRDKQYQTVVTKVKKLKDKIKSMRKAGLEKGGEYSLENLVFKVLRRTPFMDQLDSYKAKAYDNLMSVTENIKPPTNSGFFVFKNAKDFAKNFLNMNLVKELGIGGSGASYLTDKGTKLKFTYNDNEYAFAKENLGKKFKGMADIYMAEKISDGVYVIEMEYLEPLPSKDKPELKKTLDAMQHKKPLHNTELAKKVDAIKKELGNRATDLYAVDNYGIKNKELATFDPVAEEETRHLKGGILLLKGAKLEDGTTRLYVTAVNKLMHLNRQKLDGSKGEPATMAVLGNQVFKVGIVDGKLKAQGIDWQSEGSMLKHLGLSRRDVALNNQKTPLHWETLKHNNIAQALNANSEQILALPGIKW